MAGYDVEEFSALRQALSGRLSPAAPPSAPNTPGPLHQRLSGALAGVSVDAPRSGGSGTDLDRLMAAIAGKESGGNYNAVNRDSGAAGKYQIMPSNWAPWSKEAGLAGAARTPENQEAVARYKLGQYLQQFGAAGAAAAWYGGPSAAKESARWDRGQGKYPTIRQYVSDILRRLG